MSTSLRQQLASYWQRIQFLETENERLTRELAEARAHTRRAVRKALCEVSEVVWDAQANGESPYPLVKWMIARLDAEEPKP